MSLEVLLHVVCSGEFLRTSWMSAGNGLLGRVNLGMTRGVARSGECLLAAVAVTIPAWVTLTRAF